MGVHERKRAKGKVYGISFMAHGRQVQEIVGTDKRAAERLHKQRLREVAKGVYVPQARSANISVQRYAEIWCERRTNVTALDDARWLRDHILPRVGELRLSEIEQPDVVRLVRDLQADETISLKSAKNAYGVFRTMMRDATIERLILGGDPCVLPKGSWRKQAGAERQVYTAHEVVRFVTDEQVDWDRRVLFALWFYTGGREGEACGLKWQQWKRDVAPLGALAIDWQYDHLPLKTNNPRRVPVHPHLAEILQRWFDEGFALIYGRAPKASDWIVPRRRQPHRPHTKSSAYKAFKATCELLDIPARSLHATRHTMITWARRGGADRDVLEKITHNAKGQIIDAYTHWDWEPLCTKAILKLDYLGAAGARNPGAGPTALQGSAPAQLEAPAAPQLQAPELATGAERAGYVGPYVASPETPEILGENGGGAGNRTRRSSHEPSRKQANAHEREGVGTPSDSRQFAQVDARYAAHHSSLDLAARTYLETGATGKSCAHLALQLAAAVMAQPIVQQAIAVLAGGAHVHSRATELAAIVLSREAPPEAVTPPAEPARPARAARKGAA